MAPQEKIAIVTGATGGIGAAIGTSLAAEGFGVVLVGRDPRRLEELSTSFEEREQSAWTFACDLTNAGERSALLAFLGDTFDQIGALVHSAGAYQWAAVQDSSDDDLNRLLTLNTIVPLSLSRALVPRMQAGASDIVFLNSSVVQGGGPGLAAYAASKHALKGAADCLRAEVNELGIRVLSIYPGRTASGMQERVHAREGRPYTPDRLLQPEDIASIVTHAMTLPRTAEITDLYVRPHAPPRPPQTGNGPR